jgi:hypothetical protein
MVKKKRKLQRQSYYLFWNKATDNKYKYVYYYKGIFITLLCNRPVAGWQNPANLLVHGFYHPILWPNLPSPKYSFNFKFNPSWL